MAQIWQDMFVTGVPILEKIVRPIMIYGFLVVGLRLSGKRELAQLNPFDLVVLLTLSNTVQNAIIGDDNSLLGGVIGATTLLGVNYLVARFLYSHPRAERLVEGDEVLLIEHEQVQHENLARELLTLPDLESAARRQGYTSLENIDKAILEMSGAISFLPKEPTPEAVRHNELLARLEQLAAELAGLRAGVKPG